MDIFRHYKGRLLCVFILNLLSVVLTIFVFLMIEPFCRLLFYGDVQHLSPVSSLAVSLLSSLFSFSTIGNSIAVLIAFSILLYFLKTVFAYAAQWVMAHIRSDAIYDLRNQLFHKILTLPIGYFTAQRRGDVVSCAVNDTQEVEFTILNSIRQFMTEPISALIYLAFLFYLSPKLTLYSLLLLPVTFLIIGRLASSLRKSARVSKQRLGLLLSHVEETLSGLRVIKSFNAQSTSERVFHDLNDNFTETQTGIYRRIELSSPLSEFLGVTVVNFTEIQMAIYEKCPEDELTIIMRRYMMRIAEHIANETGCIGLITGESIGQVASQTMQSLACTNEVCELPVYRPLIAFDKQDIVTIAEKINTYETSILPYEDCCTTFVAEHPVTKPTVKVIARHEERLADCIDEMFKTAVEGREIIEIK